LRIPYLYGIVKRPAGDVLAVRRVRHREHRFRVPRQRAHGFPPSCLLCHVREREPTAVDCHRVPFWVTGGAPSPVARPVCTSNGSTAARGPCSVLGTIEWWSTPFLYPDDRAALQIRLGDAPVQSRTLVEARRSSTPSAEASCWRRRRRKWTPLAAGCVFVATRWARNSCACVAWAAWQ